MRIFQTLIEHTDRRILLLRRLNHHRTRLCQVEAVYRHRGPCRSPTIISEDSSVTSQTAKRGGSNKRDSGKRSSDNDRVSRQWTYQKSYQNDGFRVRKGRP